MADPIRGRETPSSFIIVPARLESTRLPRKLLLRETGMSVLQHTCEAASRARLPCGVLVATDAVEILDEVAAFGGRAVLTTVERRDGSQDRRTKIVADEVVFPGRSTS